MKNNNLLNKLFKVISLAFIFCLSLVFSINNSNKVEAMMGARFVTNDLRHEEGLTSATIEALGGNTHYTVYIIDSVEEPYNLTVGYVKTHSYGSASYIFPNSGNNLSQEIEVRTTLKKGSYVIVAIDNDQLDTITLSDVELNHCAWTSFEVLVDDPIIVEDDKCFYHWILISMLVLFVAYAVVDLFVLKKNTFDLISIIVSSIFAIASLVIGIIAIQCTICLVFMIVNLIVDLGLNGYFTYNKYIKEESK